jgi:hypothetical protein
MVDAVVRQHRDSGAENTFVAPDGVSFGTDEDFVGQEFFEQFDGDLLVFQSANLGLKRSERIEMSGSLRPAAWKIVDDFALGGDCLCE